MFTLVMNKQITFYTVYSLFKETKVPLTCRNMKEVFQYCYQRRSILKVKDNYKK